MPEQAVIGSLAGWCAVPGNPLGGVEYHIVGTRADGASPRTSASACRSDRRRHAATSTAPATADLRRDLASRPPAVADNPHRSHDTRHHRARHPHLDPGPNDHKHRGDHPRLPHRRHRDARPLHDQRRRRHPCRTPGTATTRSRPRARARSPSARSGSATATLTGPDLIAPIPSTDIGTATLTTTRNYPVNEIRSVLQP